MTFLNLVMLLGGLAFSIPLLLHLLHRHRHPTIDWGAIHLLQSIIEDNQRRWRIQEWLLLLIRCSIPVLIALCMARPLLTSWSAGYGQPDPSLVIVMDDSQSMSRTREDQQSFWDAAIEQCQQIALNHPRTASLTLIAGGRKPVMLQSAKDVRTEIENGLLDFQPNAGPCQPWEALSIALDLAQRTSPIPTQIVLISDFQANDWSVNTTAEIRELLATRKDLTPPPRIAFLPIQSPAVDAENPLAFNRVGISHFRINPEIAPLGSGAYAEFGVRNLSSANLDSVQMQLRFNGRTIGSPRISVASGQVAEMVLEIPAVDLIDRPGQYAMELSCDEKDGWLADNYRYASFRCSETVPVVVLRSKSENAQDAKNKYLNLAISPFSTSLLGTDQAKSLQDRFQAISLTPREWQDGSHDLSKVVVVEDLAELPAETAKSLTDYVGRGGAVLGFLGPASLTGDDFLHSPQGRTEFLLPGKPLVSTARGPDNHTVAPTHIARQRFEHPAMFLFNDENAGDLSLGEVTQWVPLDEKTFTGDTSVLARYSNGDAFAVEKSIGKGTMITITTSATPSWNNLSLQPIFVPFLQETLRYLIDRNVPQGEFTSGSVAQWKIPRVLADEQIRVEGPNGQLRDASVELREGATVVHWTATRQCGVYTIHSADTLTHEASVIAQQDDSESDFNPLTSPELNAVAKSIGATVVVKMDSWIDEQRHESHGGEIWKLLWLSVLLFLVLERWVIRGMKGVFP